MGTRYDLMSGHGLCNIQQKIKIKYIYIRYICLSVAVTYTIFHAHIIPKGGGPKKTFHLVLLFSTGKDRILLGQSLKATKKPWLSSSLCIYTLGQSSTYSGS